MEKNAEIVSIGKYSFDFNNQSMLIDGKIKRIMEKESYILHYQSIHRNNLIKREDLLKQLWGRMITFLAEAWMCLSPKYESI